MDTDPAPAERRRSDTDDPAVALADEYWDFHRSTSQLWNIDRGDVDQIANWEDLSAEGTRERIATLDEFASRARALAPSTPGRHLPLVEAVEFGATSTAESLCDWRDSSLVGGAFGVFAYLTAMMPDYELTTVEHGRGYVAKVDGIPGFLDGWIDGIREGAAVGRMATARGVARAVERIDRWLDTPITDDPLTAQPPPTECSASEVAEWREDVLAAVRDVRPALARLRAVLVDEIGPSAPGDDRPGMVHRPGGAAAYGALLHAASSIETSAETVHALGHEQLARLDDEYAAIGGESFRIDRPDAVRARLRDDASLQYRSADDVLADAVEAMGRADAVAAGWFTTLPAAPCRAVGMGGGGLAFYTAPPSVGGSGTYFVNTADPSMWTRFSLEATTFHEAVPGHHLQLSLNLERGLHPVLGELEIMSTGEGWGLYAERLADEMDLYSGPLQRLGMLTLDSLRAARLVVDTGLHAMGWTRDEAIEFLADATPLPRANVEGEVDRYIAGPGQATSYMIGRLEIERLRRLAESRLGGRFRVADFHDAVLGAGMVPLTTLDRQVRSWIDALTG